MSTKIYVGGLPYSTVDSVLADLFAPYGTVTSARVITDKYTNRSRGFGFVEMATGEEAKAAISGLNGTRLEERELIVNEAKPQERREGSGSRGPRW